MTPGDVPEHPDEHALKQEHPDDLGGRGPQGLHDPDLSRLLHCHRDERARDSEGRDDDQKHQNDKHYMLLSFDRVETLMVFVIPRGRERRAVERVLDPSLKIQDIVGISGLAQRCHALHPSVRKFPARS